MTLRLFPERCQPRSVYAGVWENRPSESHRTSQSRAVPCWTAGALSSGRLRLAIRPAEDVSRRTPAHSSRQNDANRCGMRSGYSQRRTSSKLLLVLCLSDSFPRGGGHAESVPLRTPGDSQSWTDRVAKLHDRGTPEGSHSSAPDDQLGAISEFVRGCRKPAVLEAGNEPFELRNGNYAVEIRSGRLFVEAWSDDKHFCRRILSVHEGKGGVLD